MEESIPTLKNILQASNDFCKFPNLEEIKMVDEHTLKMMKTSQGQYLGAHTSSAFEKDPKHLAFTLSRYKFVAKMFQGKDSVLEVGCGDGFGTTIVAQSVKSLIGIDYEAYSIENSAKNKWLQHIT